MPAMEYPNTYLRGISNQDQFDFEDNLPTPRLFPFQSDRVRPDGWIEESVSWLDDNYAIQVTMNQVKEEGGLQFKYGIAMMKSEGLKYIKAQLRHLFDYERSSLKDNDYHGNLLVHSNIRPMLKKMVSSWLLVFYEERISQPQ